MIIETKGRSLEEMDEIFGDHSAVHDAQIMDEVQGKVNASAPNHPANSNKVETTV